MDRLEYNDHLTLVLDKMAYIKGLVLAKLLLPKYQCPFCHK